MWQERCFRKIPVIIIVIQFIILIYVTYKKSDLVDYAEVDLNFDEIWKVENIFANVKSQESPVCRSYRRRLPKFGFKDGDMDLAFTVVVHEDPIQIARLLRMIYRSQNFYCIHIDKKASEEFARSVEGIALCLGKNVEVVPPESRVDVTWGDESIIKPQFVCAELAMQHHKTWKYLINLVGQEFPLRTNLELVAALKALRGANLVEGGAMGKWMFRVKNTALPMGATWYKGTIYGAFRRDFLKEVILGDSVAPIRNFIMQPKMFRNPDEFLFPTLAYNAQLGLPGSCKIAPAPLEEFAQGYLGRYVIWRDYGKGCPTKFVREVCILGKYHLPELLTTPKLFANKFHADYESETYDELENWYFWKVTKELEIGNYSKEAFDPTPYAKLSCANFHV